MGAAEGNPRRIIYIIARTGRPWRLRWVIISARFTARRVFYRNKIYNMRKLCILFNMDEDVLS